MKLYINVDRHCQMALQRLSQIISFHKAHEEIWSPLPLTALEMISPFFFSFLVNFLDKHIIFMCISLITVKLGIFSYVYWPSTFFLYICSHIHFLDVLHCFVVKSAFFFFLQSTERTSFYVSTQTFASFVVAISCVRATLFNQFLIVGHSSRSLIFCCFCENCSECHYS